MGLSRPSKHFVIYAWAWMGINGRLSANNSHNLATVKLRCAKTRSIPHSARFEEAIKVFPQKNVSPHGHPVVRTECDHPSPPSCTASSGGISSTRTDPAVATNALEHEADIAKVQSWLGHESISTTRLYDKRKDRPEESPTYEVEH